MFLPRIFCYEFIYENISVSITVKALIIQPSGTQTIQNANIKNIETSKHATRYGIHVVSYSKCRHALDLNVDHAFIVPLSR